MQDRIIAYKGFNRDWTCRDFQYEVGKTFEKDGEIKVCGNGFHACLHPLDVFNYYPPASSRFALVEMSGDTDQKEHSDTKIASARIEIKPEIQISEMIKAAVKHVFDAAKWIKGHAATGYRGAASATGDSGAASATGDSGAASATGDRGAASATGDSGAAMACGYGGRAMAAEGCAIFLTERNDDDEIISVFAGIAGQDGVDPMTWYSLVNGKLVEV
ncbi:hypothetical protein PhaeoP72_01180 [Phaeobacter inhibens]|nr:hypothetical protein PhaeoP72_01180 [Phaeobacter inhibens]